MEILEHSFLIEALDYNQENGIFIWKERPVKHFNAMGSYRQTNKRFAGKQAGFIQNYSDNVSYLQIRLQNKLYLAHRLAWFYVNKEWPHIIDHIDRDGLNNSISNLRNVDSISNGRNCRLSKNNTSGYNGIYWNTAANKWCAEGHYTENGINKKKYLGVFENIEEAVRIRKQWEEDTGGFSEIHGYN